jgi:hypothetical protein
MLARVEEDPDSFAITLHVAALHRADESQRYPLRSVEFLRLDVDLEPAVAVVEVPQGDGFDSRSVLDRLEWDRE